MNDLNSKLHRLVNTLNAIDELHTGTKYWLNQRCLILMGHLYAEHFINRIYSLNSKKTMKNIEKLGFQHKIDKLKEQQIIADGLFTQLDLLNDARNAIGHNLKIVDKLSNVNNVYLDTKSTKIEIINIITGLANKINLK